MRVAIPEGDTYGWGIAGKYLSREMAALPPLSGVTLHCVAGHHFVPSDESLWDQVNIGYCFFEHEIVAYRFIPEAARRWDHIVAGSTWCEHHLKIAGMENSSTILQGIDADIFHYMPERPDDGRFIVFSGGKFEFRKGHDLVIAAMKLFMARHPDVWLSCAWHNHWPRSVQTMEQSGLIIFSYEDIPPEELFLKTLAANGIDTRRVLLHPVLNNSQMSRIYAEADLGLFPNRCEGGNNMVMCEFMACGRPVIASTMTGHRDVVSEGHALCLSVYEPVLARVGGEPSGVWFEPKVEEILYLLEKAYADRVLLRLMGDAAAEEMKRLSWREAAARFHQIATKIAEKKGLLYPPASGMDSGFEQGVALFEKGLYAEAEECFRRILLSSPLDPAVHNAIGTTLDRLGRYPEAVLHYEKALALRPGYIEARFNLANTLKRMGDGRGAIEQLGTVTKAAPDFLEAWQNLALCRFDAGDLAGAAYALEQALRIRPDCRKSRSDLGEILIELNRFDEAAACFRLLLEETPNDAGLLNSLGIALHEGGDLDGAEQCYRTLLASDPDNSLALNNLGTLLRCRGRLDEALACLDRAVAAVPGDGQLLFNRSLVRLLKEDFAGGWADYEHRFTRAEDPVRLEHGDLPRWNGEPLAGRRLLVQAEQGYGDTFQFVRYLPLLAQFGGRVVFECQDRSVKSALTGLEGVEAIVARGDQLPEADCQVPLLSLPGIFGTTLDSIPFPQGYLKPDQQRVQKWAPQLETPGGRLKVGLVWGGRKTRLNADRSLRLDDLAPLLAVGGVRFISLQVGEDAAQLIGHAGQIEDFGRRIRDFGDTAAILAHLDLLISIDSAVAHLAGALGVRTWLLLKFAPDWRWFCDRQDSPWYQSMRLFRQESEQAGWAGVVRRLAEQLRLSV